MHYLLICYLFYKFCLHLCFDSLMSLFFGLAVIRKSSMPLPPPCCVLVLVTAVWRGVSAGCYQPLCVAITVTTQMVQRAPTHGSNTARGSRHFFSSLFSLHLPLFFPSVNVCHSLRLCPSSAPAAPVSPALPCCPSLSPSVRGSVHCPDAANQPRRKQSSTLKGSF